MKTRLYAISLAILAAGLCGSFALYLTAEEAPAAGSSFIVVDGMTYPIDIGSSKRYVRDLERMGGKASVLFDEINRWWGRLWQGEALALTVASISIAVSLSLALFAWWLPSDAPSGAPEEDGRDRPDS